MQKIIENKKHYFYKDGQRMLLEVLYIDGINYLAFETFSEDPETGKELETYELLYDFDNKEEMLPETYAERVAEGKNEDDIMEYGYVIY